MTKDYVYQVQRLELYLTQSQWAELWRQAKEYGRDFDEYIELLLERHLGMDDADPR